MKEEKIRKEKQAHVSPAVVKRLPRYYRYLRELLNNDTLRISSGELSHMMNVTASQIRQDLNCFGGFGQQGYGYNVKYLFCKIGEILGVQKHYHAIIIGAGHLGKALAASPLFERRGVRLTALFDIDPDVIGTEMAGYRVLPMDQLDEYCKDNQVDIAVLTLTKNAVNNTAAHLSELGIKGLWNFSSTELELEGSKTVVESVHMGDSLMQLCYKLSRESDGTED